MPAQDEPLWIVEGEGDAVAMSQQGCTAWATTGPLKDGHIAQMRRTLASGQDIILAFDADAAGERYTAQACAALADYPPTLAARLAAASDGKPRPGRLLVARVPHGQDPEEAIRHQDIAWLRAAKAYLSTPAPVHGSIPILAG